MDNANSTRQSQPSLLGLLRRHWQLLTAPPVPDYQPPTSPDPVGRRLRELERVLDLLEQTKLRVVERGWSSGGWFRVDAHGLGVGSSKPGESRFADRSEQLALLRRPSGAGAACLIGSMLLLADDQDTAHSLDDVWRATDELYEAVHERSGRDSFPPGHHYAPAQRHRHLRVLTGWNDAPGRTQGDVVDLLNRGISRTIAACVG